MESTENMITQPPKKRRQLMATLFKKSVKFDGEGVFVPGQLAVIQYANTPEVRKVIAQSKAFHLRPLGEFFRDFIYPEPGVKLFTHLGAGIGDVFMASSLAKYLKDYDLTFHVDRRNIHVTDWYEYKPKIKPFNQAIVNNYNIETRLTRYKNVRRIPVEYAANDAMGQCWYAAMFERMGVVPPAEYRRPQVKVPSFDGLQNEITKPRSIIICPRSSCQMRSARLLDFYLPIREAYPDRPIYVHQFDIKKADVEFLDKNLDVMVLPMCNARQYMKNIYNADFVVCTDSAAIHIREGVGKPALAAFGAMTAESRTMYHLHTKSFNVESDCKHRPCFTHEERKGDQCRYVLDLRASLGDENIKMDAAPCLSGEKFQQQLYRELKSYNV